MTSTGTDTGTVPPLRAALERLLDGIPPRQAAAAVERLMTGYRTGAHAPALRARLDAVAYAAYRMPATHAAIADALHRLATVRPGWAPASHTDIGGGTGAAVWAAAEIWPGGERPTTVLDRSRAALDTGRDLATGAPLPPTTWQRASLPAAPLPPADLITVAYVLGELATSERASLLAAAIRATTPAGTLLLVEPGTPDGYARIRTARAHLTAAGWHVLAPCPHNAPCPIAGTDWCHFATRVARSSLHRRLKGGSLPYEDEKFTYLAATPTATPPPAFSRVIRHPQLRKGQVLLDLCTPQGTLDRTTVTKRDPDPYRTARRTGWGDRWPPKPG